MSMEERKLPTPYLLLQSWIGYTPCSGSPEMHPWGKPGMVPTLCWKMLNQNSPQRISELQLCKGSARVWPNKMFSDMSWKLSPDQTLLPTRRVFSEVMHFRKVHQDSTSFS